MSKTKNLTNIVRIYIVRAKLRNTFVRQLSELVGGVTELPIYGTWVGADGRLVREELVRVEAWFANEQATEVFELVSKETRRLHNANEQAVLVEFESKPVGEGALIHFA